MCWYVSVDMVFAIGERDGVVGAWIFALVSDISLSLNTIKLKKGKAICTRWNIFMEYLKKECYFDLMIFCNAVSDNLDSSQ
jgi:hypothetical protein